MGVYGRGPKCRQKQYFVVAARIQSACSRRGHVSLRDLVDLAPLRLHHSHVLCTCEAEVTSYCNPFLDVSCSTKVHVMPRTDDPPLPRVGVGGDFILCMESVPYGPYYSVLLLCSVLTYSGWNNSSRWCRERRSLTCRREFFTCPIHFTVTCKLRTNFELYTQCPLQGQMYTFKYCCFPHYVPAESAVWETGVRGGVDNRLLI